MLLGFQIMVWIGLAETPNSGPCPPVSSITWLGTSSKTEWAKVMKEAKTYVAKMHKSLPNLYKTH